MGQSLVMVLARSAVDRRARRHGGTDHAHGDVGDERQRKQRDRGQSVLCAWQMLPAVHTDIKREKAASA